MDLGLTGKVALVTAASHGLGRATALAFGREGAKVSICSRDAAALESTAAAIRADSGAEVQAFTCDLVDPAQIVAMVDGVVARFVATRIATNALAGALITTGRAVSVARVAAPVPVFAG